MRLDSSQQRRLAIRDASIIPGYVAVLRGGKYFMETFKISDRAGSCDQCASPLPVCVVLGSPCGLAYRRHDPQNFIFIRTVVYAKGGP